MCKDLYEWVNSASIRDSVKREVKAVKSLSSLNWIFSQFLWQQVEHDAGRRHSLPDFSKYAKLNYLIA